MYTEYQMRQKILSAEGVTMNNLLKGKNVQMCTFTSQNRSLHFYIKIIFLFNIFKRLFK